MLERNLRLAGMYAARGVDDNSRGTDGKLLLQEISACRNCSSAGCLECMQFHNWFRLHKLHPNEENFRGWGGILNLNTVTDLRHISLENKAK